MNWKAFIFCSVLFLAAKLGFAAAFASEYAGGPCREILQEGQTSSVIILAGRIISYEELKVACPAAAKEAVKDSQEWERMKCTKQLNISPQVISTSYDYHLRRCYDSLGIEIENDRRMRREFLTKCRDAIIPPTPTPPPTTTTTEKPSAPTPMPETKLSGKWNVTIINPVENKEYQYVYKFTFSGDEFQGKYMDPKRDKSTFTGQLLRSGEAIQYTQEDKEKSYQATYVGKRIGQYEYQGAVCDSKGNVTMFLLKKVPR
jgi:hypothetical protein